MTELTILSHDDISIDMKMVGINKKIKILITDKFGRKYSKTYKKKQR